MAPRGHEVVNTPARQDKRAYDPNIYRDGLGGPFDFTLAEGYNEDIVRNNLNSVKHPNDIEIKAPTLKKQKVAVDKPNYVNLNKLGMRKVHSLN